jgi:hypothetical protein
MRKAILFLIFFLSLSAIAGTAAGTESDVHIENSSVETEMSLELHAGDEKLNYWRASVELPEGASIVSVEDSLGEIDEYEVSDGVLTFKTNTGRARETETVTVDYVVDNAVIEEFGGLRLVEIPLVSFSREKEETRVRVTADDEILSTSPAHGFNTELTAEEAVYVGEGGGAVRIVVGEPDKEYGRYAVFGGSNLSEAEELYGVVPAAFGFGPPVNRHPVVFLGDDRYEEAAGEGWSSGHHRTGGVIMVRRSTEDVTETVLHETTHAYNDYALSWTDENVGWFEEGTAGYVEFLADRKNGEVRPELFGDVRYREEDGQYRVVSPRGDIVDLIEYYEGEEFMPTWDPSEGDDDRRRFGYAFSELVVREYVAEKGPDALRETYDELTSRQEEVSSEEAATEAVLDAMGRDGLRPCESSNRDEVEACLSRINGMEATVPAYGETDRDTFEYDGVEPPEQKENESDSEDGGGFFGFLRGLLASFVEFVRSLF